MQINQLNGTFPLIQLSLSAGEHARIQTGSMVYHSSSVKLISKLNARKNKGNGLLSAIGRSMFSRESSLVTELVSEQEDSICTITPGTPGDIAILDLSEDQYCINDGAFLAMDQDADFELARVKHPMRSLFSGLGGFVVMRTYGNMGNVLINGFGSISVIDLNDDSITIDNNHILAWSNSLDYDLHFDNGMFNSWLTGEGLVNTFSGVGKVYVQSLSFENFAKQLIPYLPKIKEKDD